MRGRRGQLALVVGAALATAGLVILLTEQTGQGSGDAVGEAGWAELLDKYDLPYRKDGVNDMIDSSMGRRVSYSQGDRDVREGRFMLDKADRLQAIINSISNGPGGGPVMPPPPLPPPMRSPKPPGKKPILSYTQRILNRLRELAHRVNAAAKRQYTLEDRVASAKKPRGPQGFQGPPGFPGKPGLPGAEGPAGPPGENGKNGVPGKPSFIEGLPGVQGAMGPQGKDGYDGTPSFLPGPRGPKGQTGLPGAQGVRGAPGDAGEDGRNGQDGHRGPPGPEGKNGLPAKNGHPGLPGPRGPDGMRGRRGDPGYEGPEGVPAGPAAVGPQGNPGPVGLPGLPGRPGFTGYVGMRGAVGPPGEEGAQGLNGTDGAPGRNGLAAGDVRVFGGSALETDLTCHFPFWHDGKTYTRCTTAGDSQPWCYTDRMRTRWGYCDLDVGVRMGNSQPGDSCAFPFTYGGETYTQCSGAGPPNGDAYHSVTWCFTDKNMTRYGICQQPVAGGTSEPTDVCHTPCTTDYATSPWCYTSPDRSRWGVCLFKERRWDGSFVWV